MSSRSSAFDSDRLRSVSSLRAGATGTIASVRGHQNDRVDRLLALGVTPGASIIVLQTFPAFVFLCDQTELAVEREIADLILVAPSEG